MTFLSHLGQDALHIAEHIPGPIGTVAHGIDDGAPETRTQFTQSSCTSDRSRVYRNFPLFRHPQPQRYGRHP